MKVLEYAIKNMHLSRQYRKIITYLICSFYLLRWLSSSPVVWYSWWSLGQPESDLFHSGRTIINYAGGGHTHFAW